MAVLFGLLAMVSTMIGGLIAMRARDRLHLVLGVAAGVLLGVVGFDLLPEALEQAKQTVLGVPAATMTLIGGFFTFHVLERSLAIHRAHEGEFNDAHGLGHTHGHGHGAQTVGLLAGAGLVAHSFLDGVGIGLGFQAGAGVGVAVAVAVIAHDFADGFNTFTITSLYGNARGRAMTLLVCDAVAPLAGAILGTVVHLPKSVVGLYLGYFAGVLLYLATADILPEAHARHDSRLTLACTLAGAAAIWLVVGLSS